MGIILSGTSVQRQRIQRMGRIIRKAEGKDRASLYYLHLTDTIEDRCYLPDTDDQDIFELEYCQETGEFSNPPYDKTAAALLTQMQQKGAAPDMTEEIRRCLKMGSVRSDWIPGSQDFHAKIGEAASIRDKNYWICMKKMAELSNGP